tara:strand:+ start:2996 stop:3802 length:807 start_codon:yes stop_codon:yes gene_type:complete
MIELSTLLDLVSDRQLQEYVIWLTNHPDGNEEDSIGYLMDILNDSQVDLLLEKDFKATPYSSYYGACMTPTGDCFETTMENCRTLGGRFQGPGTSCGGVQKPVMMSAEVVDTLPDDGYNSLEKELWVGNDSSQANATAQNYLRSKYPDNYNTIKYTLSGSSDYNHVWLNWSFVTDEEEYNAPVGKVFHDPAAARDPRLKNDNPPKAVTQYLSKHPEVANMYDDDDASVMLKGIIIGCLIGALGTIFGNLASEVIMDKFKIKPQFKWDQ